MKSLKLFFSLMLTLGILGAYAQQNLLVTAIFPKNFCQIYNSEKISSFKIEFQLTGITDQEANLFKTNALKSDGVINFSIESPVHGYRTVKAELGPQTDFDFIRTILQENGVRFVNDEDDLVSIYDWKPYTSEQCSKINMLNTHIFNVETKLNHTLQDPTQRAMAEGNGWFVEAYKLQKDALEAKKNYIQSIK
jgi:hypothetical protein